MFRLVFVNHIDNEPVQYTVSTIQCVNYKVSRYSDAYNITAYPTLTDTDGVERWVGNREPHSCFDVCYIYHCGECIETFEKPII